VDGVFQTIRIEEGHDPYLGSIHKIADKRVGGIVFCEMFGDMEGNFHGDPFSGVMATCYEHFCLAALIGLDIVADFKGIDIAPLEAVPDDVDLNQIGIGLFEGINLCLDLSVRMESSVDRGLNRGEILS
jgi:hypothetical protein